MSGRRGFFRSILAGICGGFSGCYRSGKNERLAAPKAAAATPEIPVKTLRELAYLGPLQFHDPSALRTIGQLRDKFPELDDNNVSWVAEPSDLLHRETLLKRSKRDLGHFAPRECVCYTFEMGEDLADRCTTRLGGVPYWPKGRPWPKAQGGEPKQFAAQFDFRNIIWPEKLPGDVLTVHFDWDWGGEGRFGGEADGAAATLVWHNSAEHRTLVERSDLPPPNTMFGEVGPFCGTANRIVDYKRDVFAEELDDDEIDDPSFLRHDCYTIHATKIGGHAPLFRTNWYSDFPAEMEPVFLCTVGSINDADLRGDRFMPARPGYDASKAGGICWLDMGVLVIAYPKGNPTRLRWCQYLP